MIRWAVALAAVLLAGIAAAEPPAEFTGTERARILRHGPWPPSWRPDPGNRVSGSPPAIELGRSLFHDPRLSADGRVACSNCHRPDRAWSDGRPRSVGIATMERNAPSLLDARWRRWLGWDGASDSLWAASLRPILEADEMGGSPASVARLLRDDPALAGRYAAAFGRAPPEEDLAAAVDAAKALAAFQETMVSARTPFDRFRDALAAGDDAAMAEYPAAARRGLAIFVGRGNCGLCHSGPAFTNGEFDDVGVGYFVAPGRVDPGRHRGIERLRAGPYSRLGPWSDDPGGAHAAATRHVQQQHRDFGLFKVPGLRGVAATAPYMHDGRLPTLRAVVRHYSELPEDRLHADGARVLRPLRLSPSEIDDLTAFLESLSPKP